MKILVRKVTSPTTGKFGLVPADANAAKHFAGFQDGDPILIEFNRNRSARQHRLYMALMNTVYTNLPEGQEKRFPSMDVLRKYITGQCGHGDVVIGPDGQTYIIPRSVAFDAMKHEEFTELLDESIKFICTEILPGMDAGTLEAEINAIIGG